MGVAPANVAQVCVAGIEPEVLAPLDREGCTGGSAAAPRDKLAMLSGGLGSRGTRSRAIPFTGFSAVGTNSETERGGDSSLLDPLMEEMR